MYKSDMNTLAIFSSVIKSIILISFFSFLFLSFCLFRVTPETHGGSQVTHRGLIGAVATSLHQSHSNAGSERRLQPPPQLMAIPDP